MPNKIEVINLDFYRATAGFDVSDELEGFIAFAYPGRFVGVGETREEAMLMAKMRLRKSRTSHTEKGKTEAEWSAWAKDRSTKILEAYKKIGMGKAQVWDEDNLEKK